METTDDYKRIIKKIELSNECHLDMSGNFTRTMNITMSEAFLFQQLLEEKIKQNLTIPVVCSTFKEKETPTFEEWLENFEKAERDLYWYNKDTLYCIEAMRDVYNTDVKNQP